MAEGVGNAAEGRGNGGDQRVGTHGEASARPILTLFVNLNRFLRSARIDLFAGGGARCRALCPNSNSPAIGLPSIEFQKLVVSGTFHLRNVFSDIIRCQVDIAAWFAADWRARFLLESTSSGKGGIAWPIMERSSSPGQPVNSGRLGEVCPACSSIAG